MEMIFKDEVFKIIGAAIEVHQNLGPGFLEAVYHEALEIELRDREIPFESQKALSIQYKGTPLSKEYIADFVCFEQVIDEIKALDALRTREESQLINYLKSVDFPVGLLINFGSHPKLEWKRFVN